MKIRLVVLLLLALTIGLSSVAAQDALAIDSETRALVVNRVADMIRKHYVFPENGKAMAAHIRTRLSEGAYDGYGETIPFCRQVTADLREVVNDKHLFVFHSPEEAREVAASKGLLSPEETAAVMGAVKIRIVIIRCTTMAFSTGAGRIDHMSRCIAIGT